MILQHQRQLRRVGRVLRRLIPGRRSEKREVVLDQHTVMKDREIGGPGQFALTAR